MTKIFKLYIDELGMSHPATYEKSPYYILVGCVIDEQYQRDLQDHAKHIKFKYWGRTDIIFHSADMARDTKDYSIFSGKPDLKAEFLKDLLRMLNSAPVSVAAAIIDKEKAHKNAWTEQTVINRSADHVLFCFLACIYTKRPCRGKVIIEASSYDRDKSYLSAFNKLLHPSFTRNNPAFTGMRDYLTSINFVTKQNHDIESQVADMLAYGVRLLHEETAIGTKFEAGSYEQQIMAIAKSKLMKMAPTMAAEKRLYFEMIDPMFVTPKRINTSAHAVAPSKGKK